MLLPIWFLVATLPLLSAGLCGQFGANYTGPLRSVLAALEVPTSSQGLVFSKTSFQIRHISPRNPRAVYFADEVYVGYVPGGEVIELTAMDPVHGPIFCTVDQNARPRPAITRRTNECLTCHGGTSTANWPGNLLRSVSTRSSGDVVTRSSSFLTTHASPFEQRWGGWYVTGTHGAMRHMGNVTVREDEATDAVADEVADAVALDREAGANITTLRGRFATANYPTLHSDIVALMVLEHQTEMHTLIARATYRVKRALHLQAVNNRTLGRPEAHVSPATDKTIKDAANQVLEHLLFKHEAHLPAPVRGTSTFAEQFARRGPADPEGRSLRQFDLETRLFRHPCSFVIYSPCFDAMPEPVLDRVYLRMWRILTGQIGRRSWGLLRQQRQAILDILLATKRSLPESWKSVVAR